MFKRTAFAIIVAAAAAAFTPLSALATDAPQKPYVVLDRNLTRLRADFNANAGKVRLLYIVGPTCGICLRGMSDLQEAIYSKKGDDPRLITFVVHVPTLGAREANVVPASRLITNAHTTNYWEETGIAGRLMEQTLLAQKIPGADQYIWDFWAIYGPKAVWSDGQPPPAPDFYQHQLERLPAERELDASVFARKVDEMLSQVAPVHASNDAASTGGPAK